MHDLFSLQPDHVAQSVTAQQLNALHEGQRNASAATHAHIQLLQKLPSCRGMPITRLRILRCLHAPYANRRERPRPAVQSATGARGARPAPIANHHRHTLGEQACRCAGWCVGARGCTCVHECFNHTCSGGTGGDAGQDADHRWCCFNTAPGGANGASKSPSRSGSCTQHNLCIQHNVHAAVRVPLFWGLCHATPCHA